MPGFNLTRNAKVLFTTNLTSATKANQVAVTAATAANTFELQVLNGISFSQSSNNEVITVAEAGLAPARSQRAFNTSLAPVEFSMSTYVRPSISGNVTCEERHLWNALLGTQAIDLTGVTLAAVTGFTRTASLDTVTFTFTSANLSTVLTSTSAVGDVINISGIIGTDAKEWNSPALVTAVVGATTTAVTGLTIKYLRAPLGTGTAPNSVPTTFKVSAGTISQHAAVAPNAAYMLTHSGGSNKNSLLPFGMVIAIDGATYLIDNCAMDSVSIDFGLDGIATLAWSGKGTAIRTVAATTLTTGTATGGFAGSYTQKNTDAKYITNKLSTVSLKSSLRGLTSPTTYTLALTGGSLTIANNINYITPENLGVVNESIGYFTGTRAISGTMNAYLKVGAGSTSALLTALLTASAETKYSTEIAVGGGANPVRVELDMPAVSLQVPSIDAGQSVLSTAINFTAQGFDASTSAVATAGTADYDVEAANDLLVRYFSN